MRRFSSRNSMSSELLQPEVTPTEAPKEEEKKVDFKVLQLFYLFLVLLRSSNLYKWNFINRSKFIIFAVFLVLISSTNDVAGQIQTVPMGNFSFFLGIFNGFAYCMVYFIILSFRLYFGYTDKEQLKVSFLNPWHKPFIPRIQWLFLSFFIVFSMPGFGIVINLLN